MNDLVKTEHWDGCYNDGWKDVITPESFAHPAKFSRGLIERIYRHCLERDYLQKGDLVGDCFAGVGTGGIMAAYAGLRWLGVELEPRFVVMAQANFDRHATKWKQLGVCPATIWQGDSRQFDKLVGQARGIVTSPPYADQFTQTGGGIYARGEHTKAKAGFVMDYGTSPGQIGSLTAGDLSAVCTSPPYEQGLGHGGGERNIAHDSKGTAQAMSDGYPSSPGQIGRLKGGELAGVCASPPYATEAIHGGHGLKLDKFKDPKRVGVTSHAIGRNEMQRYGKTEGNIGNGGQETYWQAVRDVYAASYRAIKLGGVLVLVTKDYVKNRNRVALSDDTVTLCESLGFVLLERVQAMLVSETRHADLFNGEDVKRKERKSFFRRLAESKGSPRIDHEDVLFFRRPSLALA